MSSSPEQDDKAVPAALRARIDELLRTYAGSGDRPGSDAQLDTAIRALAALVASEAKDHTALELLAIDALATGAFVSERDPAKLALLADRACRELMALGTPHA